MAHDARPDGETDMTADNIAPEDVPTRDPANTEVGAGEHGRDADDTTHDTRNHDKKEDE